MGAPPRSPKELSEHFYDVDANRLERARVAVAARSIDYPLGSGEAEEVALLAGLKPLIRQLLDPKDLIKVRESYEKLGFVVRVAEYPGDARLVLLAGRDPERVRAAADCDRLDHADREYGQLFGYPDCCIDAFFAFPKPRRNAGLHAYAFSRTQGPPHPRLNVLDLAIFHFIPWMPCSFSCAASIGFADRIIDALSMRYSELQQRAPREEEQDHIVDFLKRIDRALSAHRLLLMEDVQLSIAGRFINGVIEVDRIWPTASDRPARATLSPDASEATARLLAAVSDCATIAVHDRTLLADGKALLRTKDALLVPFGGER